MHIRSLKYLLHTYIHIHTYTYIYIYVQAYIHTNKQTYIQINKQTGPTLECYVLLTKAYHSKSIHAYTFINIFATYIHIHTYTYIHANIHTNKQTYKQTNKQTGPTLECYALLAKAYHSKSILPLSITLISLVHFLTIFLQFIHFYNFNPYPNSIQGVGILRYAIMF